MTTQPHYLLRHLSPGAMLHIDDGEGQSVVVFKGLLWITQDGDPRDVFVGRGETFTIDRPGRVLIEAIDESRLLVLHDLGRADAAPRPAPRSPRPASAAA